MEIMVDHFKNIFIKMPKEKKHSKHTKQTEIQIRPTMAIAFINHSMLGRVHSFQILWSIDKEIRWAR